MPHIYVMVIVISMSSVVCPLPPGGYGIDFSQPSEDVGSGISLVAKRILEHGVTSFCPTLVTSPPAVYHKVALPLQLHPVLST